MPANLPRARELFLHAVGQLPPAQWDDYVREACGPDAELQRQVEHLLQVHREAGSFLERPVAALGVTGAFTPPSESTAPAAGREGPGTAIGPYKLVEEIGEGGMGSVWMAQQTEPVKRLVALKLIKPGMDSKQVLARFEAERQVLALMDHPHIAKVHDGGSTDSGRPYFVMELVKGVPLTKYCDERRLTPRQRLELFVPVCQAIQHAHQKGIIHRDIKPSNVLVALYDGKPVPKVIDFGIAKAAGQQLTDKTLVTGFGAIVGTLEYMSPEQAELNQLDIDTRSDIYSLGVLLYELLTGTTPLEKKRLKEAALLEVLRLIREEEPPRPSTRLSTTDELPAVAANRGVEPKKLSGLMRGELDWIVMKALDKERGRRYDTANAFAQDIQRYLADEPVLACPASAWYRWGKFARRNKGRLAVASGLLLAVVVMAGSIGWAVGDRVARRATVAVQVRELLNAVRALIAEKRLPAAREKLAEARAQVSNDRAALAALAAEVEASATRLDRWQQFLDLIERAHDAETAPVLEDELVADSSRTAVGALPLIRSGDRRSADAAAFLLQALALYNILERDDWTTTLEGELLGRDQVEHLRRMAYEELLWLAVDVALRKQEHQSGDKLSPQAAARQALRYLEKAESAHRPTQAFYARRADCHQLLGEVAAAQADRQRAEETPPTLALDHHLRGLVAYDAKQREQAVQAFEAALLLEPTHYGSLLWLGICWYDLGNGREDCTRAIPIFTGCLLKRPDHALAYSLRGLAYLNMGQNNKAIADCSRAIALDPRLAHAWNSRGLAYRSLGQLDRAVSDLSRAIKLDTKHPYPWANRGLAYCDLGQYAKAVADFSQAIELDPKLESCWNNRGNAHRKVGRNDKAIADYSRAIELDPKRATTWNNRGLAYNALGQYAKAIADSSRAIELYPKDAKAWNNRGNAHQSLGQLDKAVIDFSQAVELDPKHPFHWTNRGNAYSALGQHARAIPDYSQAIELDPKFWKPWYGRGNAYAALGQFDKAVPDYSRAIELDPKQPPPWFARGVVYCDYLGQPEKAVADFSQAIELDPKVPDGWYNRGNAYSHLRQHDKAVTDYSQAVELEPKVPAGWCARGRAHAELGQQDKAVADYSRTIELDPKNLPAWSGRGFAYLSLHQFDKAVVDFSRAIELDPKTASYWHKRAIAYGSLGQPEKAVADFSRAIELEPKLANAWTDRALTYRDLGQYDKARADYQAALKLAPAHPGVNNGLAWILVTCPDAKLRDPEQAVTLAKRAVQLAPQVGPFWVTLGMAHYQAGDWKAAIAALDRSRELLKSASPYASLFLAMAHHKLGHNDEARQAYDHALQWLEQNKEQLAQHKPQAEELRRIQSEAEAALELKKP
jgi:tetratricopeptide (TPR) repeat protein/serine/threonine protein kinase